MKLRLNTYPQLNRQFDLIKASNERCKKEFPDCFHHKAQLAKECSEVVERLKCGQKLLNLFRTTLTDHQKAELKQFTAVSRYLISRFNEVVDDVKHLEQGGAE